jgi:type I restriction enzyme R subunit
LQGTVRLAEGGEVIQGASVAVMAGPNDQRGPILTDENGQYRFEGLPVGEVSAAAYAPRFNRQQKRVSTQDGTPVTLDFELSLTQKNGRREIVVKNLQVTIAEEATFLVSGLNEPLTLEQYVDYSREKTLALLPGWEALVQTWQEESQRLQVEEQLQRVSVYPDVLAEVLNLPQADPFDVLAYVAFARQPVPTREERLQAFLQQHAAWLNAFPPTQRRVIEALLEQYRLNGVDEIANPRVFRLPIFKSLGGLNGISQQFGGSEALRQAVLEVQRRLYP